MNTWTRKLRAPVVGLGIAVAAGATLSAQAAEQKASRQENIGVATGFAVGAVAGGPLGAIVGSAAGAWLGDRYHRQAIESHTLAASLDKSEAERAHLAQNISELNGSLRDSQTDRSRLTETLQRTHDLTTDVSFRTADATLTPESVARLTKLGSFASPIPGLKLRIAGYADPRGSKDFNITLSQQRAEAVAAVLKDAGVGSERLIVEGHGSEGSSSATGDLDGYALERRVTVRLESAAGGALALAK
jgi:outer membrane protein OmpA-like peptidoglycan-associated protein